MNPFFEAFVDPSDGFHDKPVTPSNREGQFAPPEAWIVGEPRMQPFFEAFVKPSDEVHRSSGTASFGICNLREGFVNNREEFVEAPWRLREAFSKTRSAKASRSPLEGFAKPSRRRSWRLHLESVRQIMTSPPVVINFTISTRSSTTISRAKPNSTITLHRRNNVVS